MPTLLQQKEQNAIKYVTKALCHFRDGQFEDGVSESRKAAETFCKGVIAQYHSEKEANQILTGDPKGIVRKTTIKGDLQFYELIDFLERLNEKRFDAIIPKLKDIRAKGNIPHHDLNDPNKELSANDLRLIQDSLIDLLKYWRVFFKSSTPVVFDPIIKSLDLSNISVEDQNAWDIFFEKADNLNRLNNYVLVLPPNNMGLTDAQMSVLTQLHWNLVFDFNTESKENCFYKVQEINCVNRVLRPITILQADSSSLLTVDKISINWVFASGIDTLPETIPNDLYSWLVTLDYPHLFNRLIQEMHRTVSGYTVILFLYPNLEMIDDIFKQFAKVFQKTKMSMIFVVESQDEADSLTNTYKWFQPTVVGMSINQLIRGISGILQPTINETQSQVKLIPARTLKSDDDNIDISERYHYYASEGLDLLHLHIESETELSKISSSFYTGATITWVELSNGADVKRNVIKNLVDRLQDVLQQAKGAKRIDLIHKPGAGGTTLSRRIAFEFHSSYPVIILNFYRRSRTIECIKEIAEKAHKAILLVVEAFKVNENDIEYLSREINNSKKNVVILYVKRSHKRERIVSGIDRIELSDKMADNQELFRFINKYQPLASPSGKQKIIEMRNSSYDHFDVIDFPLIAFADAYSDEMLFNYVHSQITQLKPSETRFLGYVAIIYHYTQKSVNENWFSTIFVEYGLSREIDTLRRIQYPIVKLLIRELDREGVPSEIWRPKYDIFAVKVLSILLGGLTEYANNEDWKDNLHAWLIDMVGDLYKSDPNLTDEIREMLKSLVVERDNSDTINSSYPDGDSSGQTSQFSKAISDIADKIKQKSVLLKIIECYPKEPHFLGHLGRFIYEKSETYEEFEEAETYINSALEYGQGDYNLWHIHGMSFKRRIDFIIRHFDSDDALFSDVADYISVVQDLTDASIRSFKKSREINPLNFHSHMTEISTTLKVLDFGKKLHQVDSTFDFLTDPKYEWYQTKFESMSELLKETRDLLTLSENLENQSSLNRSKNLLDQCEVSLLTFLERFINASEKINYMINSAGRDYRPYYRKLYLLAKLASKRKMYSCSLNDSWQYLTDTELQNIQVNIENSISEAPHDERNYRDWLKAVRAQKKAVSIDEVLLKLKSWIENAPENSLGYHQANYYLFVLHSIKALNKSSDMSRYDAEEASRYMRECVTPLISDGYSFEWYGKGTGIKQMLNSSQLGRMNSPDNFFADTSKLNKVRGAISKIFSPQSGLLRLSGGLEAFFVPTVGKFTQNLDETKEVECFVGFRFGMIHAWQVTRVRDDENDTVKEEVKPSIDTVDVKNESLDPIAENDQIRTETPKYKYITGLKILGKIELDSLEDDRNKKNRK